MIDKGSSELYKEVSLAGDFISLTAASKGNMPLPVNRKRATKIVALAGNFLRDIIGKITN